MGMICKYYQAAYKYKQLFQEVKLVENNTRFIEFIHDYVGHIEKQLLINYRCYSILDIQKDSYKKKYTSEFNRYCYDYLTRLSTMCKVKKTASEAQALLGVAHEVGLFGLKKNKKVACNYYTISAKQNNKFGTYRLAQLYEKEVGRHDGYTKALYFYRCAAKLGCIYGMHTYGVILIKGSCNKIREFETGLFYLKLAAKKSSTSYPYPYYDLAQIYESYNECKDTEPDDDYALKLYKRGADLGCPNSQYKIGKCYETGELFQTKDMAKAISYYSKAAKNGHSLAQYTMSTYYRRGLDTKLVKNPMLAYEYAKEAAKKGHAESAFIVAELTIEGCAVPPIKYLALWWYTISANNGYKKAERQVNELSLELGKKNQRYKTSRSLFSFLCC